MKKSAYTLVFLLFVSLSLHSCSTEEEESVTPVVQAPQPEPEPVEYTLTVSAAEGGTVSTEGDTYEEGTEVTITATANEGYRFTGWEGNDSTSESLTITLNSDQTLQAIFELIPIYTLTVTKSEGGTVSTEGGTYDEGTEVTITAVAADGYEFTGWTGSDSTQTSLSITVSANLFLVANFTAVPVSSSDKFELHYPLDVKEVSLEEIENIYSTSAAKMNLRNAEILTIVYPIGDFVSEGGDWEGDRFSSFQTILDDDAISLIRSKLTNWFSTNADIPDAFLSEIVEEYMVYIEGGADLSSHFGVTESARLVIIAAPPSMSVTDFKKVIIHELYHAFQQDLESESCRDLEEANSDSNSKWLIEGAAEYFAQTHAEDLGYSDTGRSALLQTALGDYNESVSEGEESSPESLGPNATTAAAAMYLMVLKGFIQESVIFDGSLFYDCARENAYGPSNSDLQFIKDNWFKISSDNGIYSFQSEILN